MRAAAAGVLCVPASLLSGIGVKLAAGAITFFF